MKNLKFRIVDSETGEELVANGNAYMTGADSQDKVIKEMRKKKKTSRVISIKVNGEDILKSNTKQNKEKNNSNNNKKKVQSKSDKPKLNNKNKKAKNVKIGMQNKNAQVNNSQKKEVKEESKPVVIKVKPESIIKEPVVNTNNNSLPFSILNKQEKEEKPFVVKVGIKEEEPQTVEEQPEKVEEIVEEKIPQEVVDNILYSEPEVLEDESEKVETVYTDEEIEIIESKVEVEDIIEDVAKEQKKHRNKNRSKYIRPEELTNDSIPEDVKEVVAAQLDTIPGVNMGDINMDNIIDPLVSYGGYDEYYDEPSRQKIRKGNKKGDK